MLVYVARHGNYRNLQHRTSCATPKYLLPKCLLNVSFQESRQFIEEISFWMKKQFVMERGSRKFSLLFTEKFSFQNLVPSITNFLSDFILFANKTGYFSVQYARIFEYQDRFLLLERLKRISFDTCVVVVSRTPTVTQFFNIFSCILPHKTRKINYTIRKSKSLLIQFQNYPSIWFSNLIRPFLGNFLSCKGFENGRGRQDSSFVQAINEVT